MKEEQIDVREIYNRLREKHPELLTLTFEELYENDKKGWSQSKPHYEAIKKTGVFNG